MFLSQSIKCAAVALKNAVKKEKKHIKRKKERVHTENNTDRGV